MKMDDERIGRLVLREMVGDVFPETHDDAQPSERGHHEEKIPVPRMVRGEGLDVHL